MKPPEPVGKEIGVIAFDFDKVLSTGTWPSPHLGEPIPEGAEALRWYATHGWAVKIYTARPAAHADRIWDWLHRHNLQWFVYDVVTDKLEADAYVDDKAIVFPFEEKK